jgi:hypothetical protein
VHVWSARHEHIPDAAQHVSGWHSAWGTWIGSATIYDVRWLFTSSTHVILLVPHEPCGGSRPRHSQPCRPHCQPQLSLLPSAPLP